MCTFNTDKIFLTWKKDYESMRRIIGVLEKKENIYIFKYYEDLELAKQEGFKNYPAFEDLHQTYTERVLEIFGNRLLSPLRRDYQDFLDYWCANNYRNNTFALLGLTGAKLLTDNFEFIAPHEEIPANFLTNLSWIKADVNVMDELKRVSILEITNNLSFVQEKENKYNKKAIKVLYKNKKFGYIKSIHCDNVYDAIENHHIINTEVKNIIRNGTIKDIVLRINIL